ncbi:hypothetical protein [Streptomyces sp. MMBL 11-1]|uniref:hypothetical protein n=1 Tax=Streptomyces sp. MMBL 11-1 TaxID=3026420 RepID=UPI00235ED3FF|nr:hypothetical protein [Streptomyces sp. MMBL 11-1]
MLRRQRRAAAAGLALAGAALATTGLSSTDGESGPPGAPQGAGRPAVRLVSAPVRIADPETVRLLRPGDQVDVIAVGDADDEARVVARGVRVARVPYAAAGPGGHAADMSSAGADGAGRRDSPGGLDGPGRAHGSGGAGGIGEADGIGGTGVEGGALVVLSVERSTATALLGASASGRLAVAVSDAN